MTPPHNALQFLDAVQEFIRHMRRREKILRLLSFFLGYGLVLFLLDALSPLSAVLRGVLLLGGMGIAVFQIRHLRKPSATSNIAPATLARTIETRYPKTDNALIHAVQFADSALALPLHSEPFVAREQTRSNLEATRIPLQSSVDFSAYRRVRLIFAALVLCWLGLLVGYVRLIRFESPRYAAVWRDSPPFTQTNFVIRPEQAQVASGSDVKVTVQVSGVLPHLLTLITQTQGNPPQSVVMADNGTQIYTLTLENLTAETTFYAQGDTGRSSAGTITLTPNAQKGKSQAQSRADQSLKQQGKPQRSQSEDESKAAKSSGDSGMGYGDKQKPLPPKNYKLGQRQAETVNNAPKTAPVIKEIGDISRFPSNYRRLLQDYFQAGK